MIIKLNSSDVKPIFKYTKDLDILLDTGAITSVYRGSENSFKLLFPTAKEYTLKALISGFNSIEPAYKVYNIPEFIIEEMTIKNLKVAIIDDNKFNYRVKFVLAGTLFNANDYTISYKRKIIDVNLVNKIVYCAVYRLNRNGETYIDGTYSYVQDSSNDKISELNKMAFIAESYSN